MTGNHLPPGVSLFKAATAAIKDRVEEINRLNVFPVPDGDTGTNMALTMDAVIADLDRLPADASLGDVCAAITHGSLMGARGNSGVILSQMLRGVCEVVGQAADVDAHVVTNALERSVTVAFQAVRKPVEGTMLTVLKDAAVHARSRVDEGLPLEEFLDAVVAAAFESVRRGPDLLPVLKENGVVDAGGYGLAILGEGLVAAAEGHEVREYDIEPGSGPIAVVPVDDWSDEEYLYCTEFLLHGAEVDRAIVESFVAERGGSELVVGDEEMYKVHVHTDEPGAVLSWATEIGEVSDVHINNMRRQTAERTEALRADGAPSKPIGFVAVAAGAGVVRILESLGADAVVGGGQTMNPSTAEILEAVQKVDAASVIVFPNNRNIIMAAQQVVDVAGKPVAVVPTTAVPQSFAGLLAYTGGGDLDGVLADVTEAALAVRAGEVTTAVKDSKGKAGPIRTGQVIGIIDHEIEVIGDDVAEVVSAVVRLLADGGETLTILAGEGLDDEALASLVARLEAEYPSLEVEGHRGDQPLYPVIVSVE